MAARYPVAELWLEWSKINGSKTMSARTLTLTPEIYDYVLAHSLRESDVLRRLRSDTQRMPQASMQISPEQGQFMALLVKLIGAKQCIEVGTFTGYSSTSVALALPEDGHVLCLDVSADFTEKARSVWSEAGVSDKITLRLGAAKDSLEELVRVGQSGAYDFAFIDADKSNYINYYELILELIRPGGLVVIDNTLWSGAVADPQQNTPDTLAIREFNEHVHADRRVDMSLLPVGDGMTLARKRSA